jgi:hypothetical protein
LCDITWLFVRRDPIQILLSHWADRVAQYGDSFSFSEYVDIRVRTPWVPGRYPFWQEYFTGDLDLNVLGEKFANITGRKVFLNYTNNVVEDLLEIVGISGSIDRTLRVNKSPGIGTVLLIRELIGTTIPKVGRVSYTSLMNCARYLSGYLTEFDQTPSPTRLPVPSSVISMYPFLVSRKNYLEDRYGWEKLNDRPFIPYDYEHRADLTNMKLEEIAAVYMDELKSNLDQEFLNFKVYELLSKR